MSFKDDLKKELPEEIIQCAEVLFIDDNQKPIGFRTLDFLESIPSVVPANAQFKYAYIDYRQELREYAATFIFSATSAPGCSEPVPKRIADVQFSTMQSEDWVQHGATREIVPGEAYYRRCRKIIGTRPLFILATGGFISDGDRVLLQKRTDNGLWGVTGGGLETGENVFDGTRREAQEETGLTVEVGRLLSINSEKECFITYPNGDRLRFIAFLFNLIATGGELHIDGVETDDLRWFPIHHLPNNVDPYLERHAEDFFNTSVVIH